MQIEDIFRNLTLTTEKTLETFYTSVASCKLTDQSTYSGNLPYLYQQLDISSDGTYLGTPIEKDISGKKHILYGINFDAVGDFEILDSKVLLVIKLESQDSKKSVVSRIIKNYGDKKDDFFNYPHPLLTICPKTFIKLHLKDSDGKFIDGKIKFKGCYLPLEIKNLLTKEILSSKEGIKYTANHNGNSQKQVLSL